MSGARVAAAALLAVVVGHSTGHCAGARSASGAGVAECDAYTARRREVSDRVVGQTGVAITAKLHRTGVASLLGGGA